MAREADSSRSRVRLDYDGYRPEAEIFTKRRIHIASCIKCGNDTGTASVVCRACDPKRAEQDANLQRHLKYQERERKGPKKSFYYWLGAILFSLLVGAVIAFGIIYVFIIAVPFLAFGLVALFISSGRR